MKKEIMGIIKKVEGFEIELDDKVDYDLHEIEFIDGSKNVYIVHQVKCHPELKVLFAEFDRFKDVRNKEYAGEITGEEMDDYFQDINELADRFDYDKVVAYRCENDDIQWLK